MMTGRWVDKPPLIFHHGTFVSMDPQGKEIEITQH